MATTNPQQPTQTTTTNTIAVTIRVSGIVVSTPPTTGTTS